MQIYKIECFLPNTIVSTQNLRQNPTHSIPAIISPIAARKICDSPLRLSLSLPTHGIDMCPCVNSRSLHGASHRMDHVGTSLVLVDPGTTEGGDRTPLIF